MPVLNRMRSRITIILTTSPVTIITRHEISESDDDDLDENKLED